MTWDEIINSPYLKDLPFKIEMNKHGQALMSPASNKRGVIKAEAGFAIYRQLKSGMTINGCSIQTSDGVKVADVAWASDAFIAEHGILTPYQKAPEICVEIVSPSNTKQEIAHKVELYLAKGAQEVWIVSEKLGTKFYAHAGEIKQSALIPKIKL